MLKIQRTGRTHGHIAVGLQSHTAGSLDVDVVDHLESQPFDDMLVSDERSARQRGMGGIAIVRRVLRNNRLPPTCVAEVLLRQVETASRTEILVPPKFRRAVLDKHDLAGSERNDLRG